MLVLRCPVVKLCLLDALGIGICLIEVLGDLIRASITGEIVAEVAVDHVLREILTTRIAGNVFHIAKGFFEKSFVVSHEFILAGEG